MTLFALDGLMDLDERYKQSAKRLVRNRYHTLYLNMGIEPHHEPNDANYYTLIDLERLARHLYGEQFADGFKNGKKATDFLFRLAKETGVVLLPGKGFEVVDPSARVSLANLKENDYAAIGRFSRRVLDEYYQDFKKVSGA